MEPTQRTAAALFLIVLGVLKIFHVNSELDVLIIQIKGSHTSVVDFLVVASVVVVGASVVVVFLRFFFFFFSLVASVVVLSAFSLTNAGHYG